MQVRPATANDIPGLLALLRQLFAIEDARAFDADVQARGLALLLGAPDRACVFCAAHEARIAGMATVQLLVSTARGGLVATAEDVVVDAALRGQGLGRALVEACAAWARARGAVRLQLLADQDNALALDFYARLGFGRTALCWLVRPLP